MKYKGEYIMMISTKSSRYGDKLLELMDKYNKPNLMEITLDEAKEFWEALEKENEK